MRGAKAAIKGKRAGCLPPEGRLRGYQRGTPKSQREKCNEDRCEYDTDRAADQEGAKPTGFHAFRVLRKGPSTQGRIELLASDTVPKACGPTVYRLNGSCEAEPSGARCPDLFRDWLARFFPCPESRLEIDEVRESNLVHRGAGLRTPHAAGAMDEVRLALVQLGDFLLKIG